MSVPDTTKPTVNISDDTAGIVNRGTTAVHYLLSFSEPVTGLEVGDFTVVNGSVSSVTGSGAQWQVSVSPAPGVGSGTIGLTLKADAVTDASGNTNPLASDDKQAIDTVAPVAPKLVTNRTIDTLVNPQVTFRISLGSQAMGDVVVELNPEAAPATVANLLAYAGDDFYDGTIFHRVISGFMAQAGGLTTGLVSKTPTYAPIALESSNGLSNLRGTIAMARTNTPDSATSQFFINLVDNDFLNYSSAQSPGYAVFGKVLSGMNVIDDITTIKTVTLGPYQNVPEYYVYITDAVQSTAGSAIAKVATFNLSDLEAGSHWQYSLDAGVSWTDGSGTQLNIPQGSYAPNAIQVRQIDANGNTSLQSNVYGSALTVDQTAPVLQKATLLEQSSELPVDQVFTWVFSETVQRGSGQLTLKTADGAIVGALDVASSSAIAINGNSVTLHWPAPLSYNTEYQLSWTSGAIVDAAGNSMANPIDQRFSTAALLDGTSGNDRLVSTPGNDAIVGGAGIDTAVYDGSVGQYTIRINRAAKTATIIDSQNDRDGTDSLTGVEKVQFGNQTFDLFNLPRSETPKFGQSNGFLFDAAYYLLSNPQLVGTIDLSSALGHYLSAGAAAGDSPNSWFDPVYYANRWEDLKMLNLSPDILFQHYNLYGVWEGRSAGPMFDRYDGARYLSDNPDVAGYVDAHVADFLGSRTNGAIAHYIIYGADERRVAYDLDGNCLESAVLIGVSEH